MSNFKIKADLLKLSGAVVTDLKGRSGASKKCLVIPVEDSGLFLGEKGCYLSLTAIEMKEARYGDTHCVKISLPKEKYSALTDEQRRDIPILGGMHEATAGQPQTDAAPQAKPSFSPFDEPAPDLPF
jgi:hypothetical protein